jgi:Skp family chaperone for outer membrane proteins
LRRVLSALLCAGILLGLAFAQGGKPPGEKKASEKPAQPTNAGIISRAGLLLEAAGIYLELGDKETAEARALEALKVTQIDGLAESTRNQIREDVKKLLDKIRKAKQAAADKAKEDKTTSDERARQKHLAQIQEAEYLLSEGKPSEASKIVQSILNETNDPEVQKQAKAISGKVNSTGFHSLNILWDQLSKVLWWIIDILLGASVLLIIYTVLKKARKWNAAKYGDRWTVRPIEDKTDLGVAGAVVESLNLWKERQAPVTAGMLKLDRLIIPAVPQTMNLESELDFADALKDIDLKIGAVSLGGIAKAVGSFRNWFIALRPSITGSVAISGDQVVVRLTRLTADAKRNSVTASAEKTKSLDAAEAASFKMYYLIASNTSVSEAESANKLREGMSLLRDYLFGRGPEKLNKAYETFRDVHMENPTFHEAYLYEGIALDLMERHDDAETTFHFLADPNTTQNDVLRLKAQYNEAVSLFRKYTRADLDRAIQMLDALIGSDPTGNGLAASPVRTMAFAAKANAISHKPLFWQEYFYQGNPELSDKQVILQRKGQKQAEVLAWVQAVEASANSLEQVYTTAPTVVGANGLRVWDETTRAQLRWAIENARGNAYLNYAKSFLRPPYLPAANEEQQRRDYLGKAYQAFANCEMILPPGVETLANMGTILIELSKGPEARNYLKRILTLNPQYEYAYYRMAQSWEKESRIDKVVEALKSFAKIKDPGIPGFKKLYEKYSIELARA